MAPTFDFLFEARGALAKPLDIGPTHKGYRRIVDIGQGSFEGPRIKGSVLPGGTDWQFVRHDGITEVEARYVLKTHDGVLIQVVARGLRHGPEDVMQRLGRGEEVDPSAYYFRVAPVFEAPAGPYEWLNRSLFVTLGARYPEAIRLRTYRLL